VLEGVKKSDQKDNKKLKQIANELVGGKDLEMTCHLTQMTQSDGTLGRVMSLDLNF
jgi:hypothetical protein